MNITACGFNRYCKVDLAMHALESWWGEEPSWEIKKYLLSAHSVSGIRTTTEVTTLVLGVLRGVYMVGGKKQWAVEHNGPSCSEYLLMFSLCQAVSLPSRGTIRPQKYAQPGMVAYNPWMIHFKFLSSEVHCGQWPCLSSSLLDPQQLAQCWYIVGTQ